MKASVVPDNHSSQEFDFLLNTIIQYGPRIIQNKPLVKVALANAEKKLITDAAKRKSGTGMEVSGVIDDQTALGLAMLNSVRKALLHQKLSPATIQMASEVLGKDLLIGKSRHLEKSITFSQTYGYTTPSFLVISPSKSCNLRCTGCYADSDAKQKSLDWDIVDEIIEQAYELWGTQFFVISGGEPMAYWSRGMGILDLAEKHPNCYFMMYTNGTLIDRDMAQRMATLGNLVPVMSLEGGRERTDERRGAGTFDKVMKAMDELFDAGVLFGNSLTATNQNVEEILSENFLDMLFQEKHTLITWIFQYMPIGRSYTLDLMPTPQQRIWMWKKTWQMVREKGYFLADFWNFGTVVDGCLSAGGHNNGGYFYIEWNGNVTPCVFVPYSPVNVKTIFDEGKTLNDIYKHPFFSGIRKWQSCHNNGNGNLLNPCLIRDHHGVLTDLRCTHGAGPIDENAAAATLDPLYAFRMEQYAQQYKDIADRIWNKQYITGIEITEEEIIRISKELISEPI